MYEGFLIHSNEHEFGIVAGKANNKRDMIARGKQLELNINALLLTLGKTWHDPL